MKYGYARVSTVGQAKDGNSLEAQKQKLMEEAVLEENIFSDAYTGTKRNRPEFEKLLKKLEPGDELIVTKLDRFARSTIDGSQIIKELLENNITVNILNLGKLDNSPSSKLMRTMFFAFSEFERDMIVERTQEGKAIARQQDDYKEGRPKVHGKKKIDHALDLLKDHTYNEVVAKTGISKSTLIRANNKRKEALN